MESLSAALDALAVAVERSGQQAWLVGGCLRDALLGRAMRDLDLVVSGEPAEIVPALAALGALAQARLRGGTIRLAPPAAGGIVLDLAPLRHGSIEADLGARDFRLNALALPLGARQRFLTLLARYGDVARSGGTLPAPAELVDPRGGYADLRARRLTLAGERALLRDPVRILRGARLAAALNLRVEAETLARMRSATPHLTGVARERIGEEVALLLDLPRAALGWRVLAAGDALSTLFPSLAAREDEVAAVTHLLDSQAATTALDPQADAPAGALARLAAQPEVRAWLGAQPQGDRNPHHRRIALLRWAALVHALARHPEEAASEALASPKATDAPPLPAWLPGGLIGRVARDVTAAWLPARALLRTEGVTPGEWRRFFARFARAESGICAVLVALACQAALAAHDPRQRGMLEPMVAQAGVLVASVLQEPTRWRPPPLLDGGALIRELGIAPGPDLGRLLAAVRDAQLAERVTTPAEALALGRMLADEMGLLQRP